jgi:hypothetical protein
MRILKILSLSFAVSATSAFAFQLGDHKKIMAEAYKEFVSCFPEFQDRLNYKWLEKADIGEDLDLVNKELFYSHFYNPHKKLRMWRKDSSGRIADLKPSLLQCRATVEKLTYENVSDVGHMVHHFQDASVPPHVVPVSHSFWDGFENFVVNGDISTGLSCDEIRRSVAEPEEILRETAETTLNAVAEWRVPAMDEDQRPVAPLEGTEFWMESNDDGFGSYGSLGNHFGDTRFVRDTETVVVSKSSFENFKRDQMRLAVAATVRGLVWALKPPSVMWQPAQTE